MKIIHKFVLLLLAVSFMPLLIVILIAYDVTSSEISTKTLEELATIASARETRINSLLNGYKSQIFDLSIKYELRIELGQYSEHKIKIPVQTQKILEEDILINNEINNYYLLEKNGDVIWSSNPELKDSLVDKEFYIKGKSQESVSLLLDSETGLINLYLTSRIFYEGEPIAILVAERNSDDLNYLLRDYTGLGRTGEIMLATLQTNGDALIMNPVRYDPSSAFSLSLKPTVNNVLIFRALSKNEDKIYSIVDYKNNNVLAVTRYIDQEEWGLVFKIDKSEALSSIIKLRNIFIALLVSILLIIVLVVYVVVKSLNKTLKEFSDATANITQGNFNKQINITSNDELGDLAKVFNEMSLKVGSYYSDLEKQVNEKTKELQIKAFELQKNNRLMVGRELKMTELKNIIADLKKKII